MAELDTSVIATEGALEALQIGVVRLLQSNTTLAAAKILHEDEGDIENQIEAAISDQGLILLVMSPEGRSDSPDAEIVIIDELKVVVRVIEFPLICRGAGGARISINRAVQLVANALHHHVISGHALVFDRFEPDPQAETPTKDVTFNTSLQFDHV